MTALNRLKARLAIAVCCTAMASSAAWALTVGDYRQANATVHILDNMTVDQRVAYAEAHRPELEFARMELESARLIAQTVFRMNGVLMEAARPPFVCNYDMDEYEAELDDWIEEFRAETPARWHVAAGPKTDAAMDQIDFDEVIARKFLEKYPCPMAKTQPAHKKTASAVSSALKTASAVKDVKTDR